MVLLIYPGLIGNFARALYRPSWHDLHKNRVQNLLKRAKVSSRRSARFTQTFTHLWQEVRSMHIYSVSGLIIQAVYGTVTHVYA